MKKNVSVSGKKIVSVSGKKSFGSDTKTGIWFRSGEHIARQSLYIQSKLFSWIRANVMLYLRMRCLMDSKLSDFVEKSLRELH